MNAELDPDRLNYLKTQLQIRQELSNERHPDRLSYLKDKISLAMDKQRRGAVQVKLDNEEIEGKKFANNILRNISNGELISVDNLEEVTDYLTNLLTPNRSKKINKNNIIKYIFPSGLNNVDLEIYEQKVEEIASLIQYIAIELSNDKGDALIDLWTNFLNNCKRYLPHENN
jgi:hypothetical protein